MTDPDGQILSFYALDIYSSLWNWKYRAFIELDDRNHIKETCKQIYFNLRFSDRDLSSWNEGLQCSNSGKTKPNKTPPNQNQLDIYWDIDTQNIHPYIYIGMSFNSKLFSTCTRLYLNLENQTQNVHVEFCSP